MVGQSLEVMLGGGERYVGQSLITTQSGGVEVQLTTAVSIRLIRPRQCSVAP